MSPRLLSTLLLALCLVHSPVQASEKDTTVRILTVGNSFARDALRFLPDMAAAGGRKLVLCTANVASASLEYHVRGIETFETDPGNQRGHPYTVSSVQLPYVTDPADPKVCPYDDKRRASLRDLLEFEKWNYITIHQKSALSYDPASYEPSAGTLIAYIRKYAPQAEILVHQTWAYREDHPAFADGSGFNQQKMFEAVRQAYQVLADRYHLRQVPVGEAFQAARATPRWTFTPDRAFDFANPPAGQSPHETGALNLGYILRKDDEGHEALKLDARHTNTAGSFLAAAVFYEFLFHDNVETNTFVPKGLTPEEATSLRQIAHQVLAKHIPVTAAAPQAP